MFQNSNHFSYKNSPAYDYHQHHHDNTTTTSASPPLQHNLITSSKISNNIQQIQHNHSQAKSFLKLKKYLYT